MAIQPIISKLISICMHIIEITHIQILMPVALIMLIEIELLSDTIVKKNSII